MKTNDILHNPFKNRFHYPVTWRLDEMQAHSNVIWLRQRDQNANGHKPDPAEVENYHNRTESVEDGRMLSGAFAFLIVLVASAIVLFRAF